MKKSLLGLSIITSLMLLTGCGGSDGGSSPTTTDTSSSTADTSSTTDTSSETTNTGTTTSGSTITGQLIDGVVEGADYVCSSGNTGITNSNGEYTCNEGDTVTFSVAGVTLGSVTAKAQITPYDLKPNDNEAAINMAQFLQTLDEDGDPSNGIKLERTMNRFQNLKTYVDAAELAGTDIGIDFTDTNFDTVMGGLMGEALVDAEQARIHMDETIATFTNGGGSSTTESDSSTDSSSSTTDTSSSTDSEETNTDNTTETESDSTDTSSSTDSENTNTTDTDSTVSEDTATTDTGSSTDTTRITSNSLLKQTGQQDSYKTIGYRNEVVTDGTGRDDGYYKAGIQASYTNENNTIIDNVTNLQWQDDELADVMLWSTAEEYCSELTLDGFDDWRLPSRNELMNIIDYSKTEAPFSSVSEHTLENGRYWTASKVADNPTGEAWSVDFSLNSQHEESLRSAQRYVRCVRGTEDEKNFTRENDVVTDTNTKLQWQDNGEYEKLSWQSAIDYCEDLVLDGKSDWRLPNINELQSIIDRSEYGSRYFYDIFTNNSSATYWSSTTKKTEDGFGDTVYDNAYGATYYSAISGVGLKSWNEARFKCVRN